jgi:hypothetical protein
MINIAAFLNEGFGNNLLRNLLVGIVPLVVLALFFMIALRFAGRPGKTRLKAEKMLAQDEAANHVRGQDISEEMFYLADINALPVREYTDEEKKRPHPCFLWQKKVLNIHQKKMLRFDRPYTNVELKHMFGVANLEFVARYEENFTNYIHTLRHWAEALLAADMQDDARTVLETAISAGSETSQTYTLLADIYAKTNDKRNLESLRNTIIQRDFPGKQIALDHINKL